MQRAKQYLFNITWLLSFCLAVLLLLGNRVQVPLILQVAGRMHPLVLHFPIVLVVLYLFWLLLIEKKQVQHAGLSDAGEWLFLFAVSSTVITALAGFLLGREVGYDSQSLQWHLWLGTGTGLYMTAWYAFLRKAGKKINVVAGIVAVFFVTVAAHLGGEITHGKGFVTAPLTSPVDSTKKVNPETAFLYADMVRPVLQNKCINCHNPGKRKGGLDMSEMALLLKGGKNGALWDSTSSPANSLLLQRIHFPESMKEHMPPTGKPQLTETERYILWSWIKHGASFTATTATLPAGDSLKTIAINLFGRQLTETYSFAPAPEATIAKLTSNYRVLQPISLYSPALKADFFGVSFFKPALLDELLAVKDQLVSLSLNKMPVTDEALTVIKQFTQLRRLNLSFTNITGKNLALLQSLTQLQQLSLSGTPVNSSTLIALAGCKSLKKVFVWNTPINNQELAALQRKMPALLLEKGYQNDTVLLKLPQPALLNESDIIRESVQLRLKNYISNAEIRYTLDGTEPDSLKSLVYNDKVIISKQGPVKARVFKPGWQSSDMLEAFFFKAKYKPDSIWMLKKTEKSYQYIPAKKLVDLERGDKDNFRDGEWLAFYENNMETMLKFEEAIPVSAVSLSCLFDPGSYIMPPLYAELWGGNDLEHLQLLKKVIGAQPAKIEAKRLEALTFNIPGRSLRYIKIIVKPVDKLPSWHPGKGQRGWFFTDEIFVN